MSIDLNWPVLTSGPDGEAFAESIRAFVHNRFQQVTLPRFIKSVHVHKFEFGTVPPELEIKDICNPLPDFYEDDDEEERESEKADEDEDEDSSRLAKTSVNNASTKLSASNLAQNDAAASAATPSVRSKASMPPPPTYSTRVETSNAPQYPVPQLHQRPALRSDRGVSKQQHPRPTSVVHEAGICSVPSTRTSTPGIPGGTSNLSYFHLPLGAGLSGNGTSTPLAAVSPGFGNLPQNSAFLPNSQTSRGARAVHSSSHPPTHSEASSPPVSESATSEEPRPEDIQLVTHLRYDGDVRLSITAEILLDFPSPAFVGIPLILNVTGMSFDGIVLLAYLRGKVCFCFLDPEDGGALVSGSNFEEGDGDGSSSSLKGGTQVKERHVGGLFEEIRIESEIGQKQDGRQALKNVGKVEKFVLEQVRKIFEQEVVYPSFWTFLV
ncbi:MAG: Mitochondrial distribution and morphology protein 12 [Chrysothrix sp. TS-e1954]|nr:MAG: Mitochondrial distribution and morphology protein 12 [Chrysothrix sp. TS-e1954]